jgi:prepilin-type processing-associated H-X9-DG protein
MQTIGTRFPTDRHPQGQLNVLYADGHGAVAEPAEWATPPFGGEELPSRYSPRVRVSPYLPIGSAEDNPL